jgi:HSP20 family protein
LFTDFPFSYIPAFLGARRQPLLNRNPQSPIFCAVRITRIKEVHMFTNLRFRESPLFGEFQRLEQELDEFMAGATPWAGGIRSLPPGTFPAVNVAGSGDTISVYLFAPGIDAKALEISLQRNVLSVSGKREVPQAKDATYYRSERFDGEFRRVIALPEDVDPDKVDASYRDGIVEIRLQRRESSKPRRIEIN